MTTAYETAAADTAATPRPWSDTTAVAIPAGDDRVKSNGRPFSVPVRVLSEPNYQLAVAAVNAAADADGLVQLAQELPRDAKSVLVYAESCMVDYGGLLEGRRMNAEDMEALHQFQAMGVLTWGRIPARLLGTHGFTQTQPTHWCRFTPKAWTLAHILRMLRAEQVGPYATAVHQLVAERAAGGDA